VNAAHTPVRNRIALTLLALALAVRVLVPAGWMPAAKGGFAITVCTGSEMQSGWIDAEGKLHKQAPDQGGGEHCAFAGLGAPMLAGDVPAPLMLPVRGGDAPATQLARIAIGQGLAAPPPPATGPPATA
jgi:hypothetical protein